MSRSTGTIYAGIPLAKRDAGPFNFNHCRHPDRGRVLHRDRSIYRRHEQAREQACCLRWHHAASAFHSDLRAEADKQTDPPDASGRLAKPRAPLGAMGQTDKVEGQTPRPGSNSSHEDKNKKNHNHEPDATRRIVAPTGTVRPRRKGANENQDQDN